jgi:hypothetical protein
MNIHNDKYKPFIIITLLVIKINLMLFLFVENPKWNLSFIAGNYKSSK